MAIRQKLIESCHSLQHAEQFFATRLNDKSLLTLLIRIAEDTDDHGGDAPMQAAHFASQFPGVLLTPHEPTLFRLMSTADGYGGSIALALGKTKSPRGKAALISALGDGSRFDAWLFRKALAEYDQTQ